MTSPWAFIASGVRCGRDRPATSFTRWKPQRTRLRAERAGPPRRKTRRAASRSTLAGREATIHFHALSSSGSGVHVTSSSARRPSQWSTSARGDENSAEVPSCATCHLMPVARGPVRRSVRTVVVVCTRRSEWRMFVARMSTARHRSTWLRRGQGATDLHSVFRELRSRGSLTSTAATWQFVPIDRENPPSRPLTAVKGRAVAKGRRVGVEG